MKPSAASASLARRYSDESACQRGARRASVSLAVACFLGCLTLSEAKAGEAPRLSQPIDCTHASGCFIQSYVDVDPGKASRDFRCGDATYDGHNGVDFRLVSAGAVSLKVPVLAAAPGRVKAVRDLLPDLLVSKDSRSAIKGRECGNGVVIDHGDGWETQYCHLRHGSVRVAVGNEIARGAHLGEVGFSGLAQFAHLHFLVRHAGSVVDPYTGQAVGHPCSPDASASGSLWDEAASRAFPYRNGEIIESGFAAAAPVWTALEGDHDRFVQFEQGSQALVFFARIINGRAGDRIRLSTRGPGGVGGEGVLKPLPKKQAIYVATLTQPRRAEKWAAGTYHGHAQLLRDGRVVHEASVSAKID